MRSFILLICSFVFCTSLFASYDKPVRVGLYVNNIPSKAVLSVKSGAYTVYGDGKPVFEFKGKALLVLVAETGKINVKNYTKSYGSFSKVEVKQKVGSSVYAVKPVVPALEERQYTGDIEVLPSRGKLKMISVVKLPDYVAGVVQSEAGNGHHPEFYKAQAIISRTYALKHMNRYLNEGYNLCDRVNSQVYKTRGYNDTIIQAVRETQDVVLVDADINLITAAFHSNSGGGTLNSEDVWSGALSYLRAVEDTFSNCMPHYEWETRVSKNEYLDYFKVYTQVKTDDPVVKHALLTHCPKDKELYLFPKDSIAPLKSIRNYFKLNSTHFCVENRADSVSFIGRGFGHAVGLSQEGAMRMADLGYHHRDILNHYYRNVHLIKKSVIDFFRMDDFE